MKHSARMSYLRLLVICRALHRCRRLRQRLFFEVFLYASTWLFTVDAFVAYVISPLFFSPEWQEWVHHVSDPISRWAGWTGIMIVVVERALRKSEEREKLREEVRANG